MEKSSTAILGLSAFYHDSAAALLVDGELVAAAQEERFTRKKHDAGFPEHAVRFCLNAGRLGLGDVEHVVFYDKPLLKFERLLETYLAHAPRGIASFVTAMPVWLHDKLFLKTQLRKELAAIGGMKPRHVPPLLFAMHHQAHAASAFFPSPYDRAAVLCLDGVGEWASTSLWLGEANRLDPLWQIDFPHSLGLLYSAFTYYTGFKVNSGEYKVMGLAPYGTPRFAQTIFEHLIDLKPDGTFRLNLDYFDYPVGLRMTSRRFHDLFGGPPRNPEARVTQREMDLAASIQAVTEEVVLRLARTAHRDTGCENLCMAGGVALNCVANGRLLREGPFAGIWIQPAAGDAGGAVGAAYSAWHEYMERARTPRRPDAMRGSYLGPRFSSAEIRTRMKSLGASFVQLEERELIDRVASVLGEDAVVGWFQGRMEFGPRALGARSIIGDARSPRMQSQMNLKIKFRESFRPFAPAVLAEHCSDYFDLDRESPYMLLVAAVKEERRRPPAPGQSELSGIDLLNVVRSEIPAVTHVDYSARIQTVDAGTNPRFHALLSRFQERTGVPVLVNTSFNVRGEPIVCTPEDAYRCFMRTNMDYLVIEDFLLDKSSQPPVPQDDSWQREFELD